MNGDEHQSLILLRLSVDAIRRQFNRQMDGLEAEINRLIPEEEGRGRHIPSLQEMRDRIDKACHRNPGNHRTDRRVLIKLPRKPKACK